MAVAEQAPVSATKVVGWAEKGFVVDPNWKADAARTVKCCATCPEGEMEAAFDLEARCTDSGMVAEGSVVVARGTGHTGNMAGSRWRCMDHTQEHASVST